MNPSQEQDQTASNVFIEGELSEEDLRKIAGGAAILKVEVSSGLGLKRTTYVDGTVKIEKLN